MCSYLLSFACQSGLPRLPVVPRTLRYVSDVLALILSSDSRKLEFLLSSCVFPIHGIEYLTCSYIVLHFPTCLFYLLETAEAFPTEIGASNWTKWSGESSLSAHRGSVKLRGA